MRQALAPARRPAANRPGYGNDGLLNGGGAGCRGGEARMSGRRGARCTEAPRRARRKGPAARAGPGLETQQACRMGVAWPRRAAARATRSQRAETVTIMIPLPYCLERVFDGGPPGPDQ
jgi:hypothetical protein